MPLFKVVTTSVAYVAADDKYGAEEAVEDLIRDGDSDDELDVIAKASKITNDDDLPKDDKYKVIVLSDQVDESSKLFSDDLTVEEYFEIKRSL